MKKFSALVLAASLLVGGTVWAESMTAISNGSGKDTVIQNSEIITNAKTGNIDAKDKATVKAATVDVSKGTTIQNSKISAASSTGNIKASGNAEVNAGGVNLK